MAIRNFEIFDGQKGKPTFFMAKKEFVHLPKSERMFGWFPHLVNPQFSSI
jgi:hypothetical protein